MTMGGGGGDQLIVENGNPENDVFGWNMYSTVRASSKVF